MCDRCGRESDLTLIMPKVETETIVLNWTVRLCQDCLIDYLKNLRRWWNEENVGDDWRLP